MKHAYTITLMCGYICLTNIYAESNTVKIGWVDHKKVEDQTLLYRDVALLKETLNNSKNNDVNPFVRFETLLSVGARLAFGAWFDSDLKPIARADRRIPFGPSAYNLALGFVSFLDNDVTISYNHAKDIVQDIALVNVIIDSNQSPLSDAYIDVTDDVISIMDSEYKTYGISKQGLVKMGYPFILAQVEQATQRRSEWKKERKFENSETNFDDE